MQIVGVAESLLPFFEEGLVLRRVALLRPGIGDHDAIAFGRGEHAMLIADAERRRGHRDFRVHAGCRPLPIEGHMRAADQDRHDDVGLGFLDLGDGRAEIGDIEREEIGLDDLAAIRLRIMLHPFGGDLAVIIVGGERVDLLAPFLDDRREAGLPTAAPA